MADKIARWLQCQDSGWQCCSFCGVAVRKSAVKWVKASEDKNLNYCPHCGARMGYLQDIRKEPRWISVKDRLPENQNPVMVFVPPHVDEIKGTFLGYVGMAYYTSLGEGFWCGTDGNLYGAIGMIHTPTHWMPLPEPPKENE